MSNPSEEARLREIVERVGAALGEIVEEYGVTTDEWHAALAYLTEVGRRDEFILLSDVMQLSVAVDRQTHPDREGLTPHNVLGPFWRPDAPILDSPARICREDEPGEPFLLRGSVRSADGRPLAGALLDVWETGASGHYDLEDPDQPDVNLRARVRAAGDGSYEIRTITPVPYEVPKSGPVGRLLAALGRHAWRPAHIHARVEAEGHEPLTTMIYMAGDPWLDDDTIGSVKDALVVEAAEEVLAGGERVRTARFDFVLAPAGGRAAAPASRTRN